MHLATRSAFNLAALLFLAATCLSANDDQPAKFAPVAPAPALGRVLELNFDQVGRWCDENDLASAAQASQSALVLAAFLARHATDKARPHADALLKECKAVESAARSKNMAATRAKLAASKQALAPLLENLSASQPSWTDFKPTGANRAWMVLLDAGYADAKFADKPADFEALALTLAEEANVVALLRKEPRWREMAFAVRDSALAAAKQNNDLPEARKTLRAVYTGCESCHQAYRR
jgi:hypothetical protein